MLNVPTTLEPGLPDTNFNLYDAQSRFDYMRADRLKLWSGRQKLAPVVGFLETLKQTTSLVRT